MYQYPEVFTHIEFYGKDGNTKDTKLTSLNMLTLTDYQGYIRNSIEVSRSFDLRAFEVLQRKGDLHLLNEDTNGIDEIYALFYLFAEGKIEPRNQEAVVHSVALLLSEVCISNMVRGKF